MDGGSGEPVAWRSSIPGVSQRDGAPVSLGLAGRGVQAMFMGEAGVRRDDVDPPIELAGVSRSGGRRQRRVVPWRAIGLAVVALVAIVGVARAAGVDAGGAPGAGAADTGWERGPSPDASAPAAEPGDESLDWWTTLAHLDAQRVRALTEVDPALLSTYAQPGSAAWEEDAALLASLSARGLRPRGLASRVLAVERVDHVGSQARLQVVDERTGYSTVDSAGGVVQQVAPAGPRRWSVTLSLLVPTATDASSAGESLEGGSGTEGSAGTGHFSGRDPGWRVAAVVPVESGESPGIEAGGEASAGAEDATAEDVP